MLPMAPSAMDQTLTPSGGEARRADHGIDLAQPLSATDFALILRAIWQRTACCAFPASDLDPAAQAAFSRRFGTLEVHVSGAFQVPEQPGGHDPVEHGGGRASRSASPMPGRTGTPTCRSAAPSRSSMCCMRCRCRGGTASALGDTLFADMAAAYDDLPPALQARLASADRDA